MPSYADALKKRTIFGSSLPQTGQLSQPQASGGLNLPPAQQRMNTASRMQSFYEPAYFGPQSTAWGDWSFSPVPSTMGGFDYRPLDDGGGMPLPDWAEGTIPDNAGLIEQFQARQPYDSPPVGARNLANYGVGQLGNYGVGALRAYQPLAREETLRYRR